MHKRVFIPSQMQKITLYQALQYYTVNQITLDSNPQITAVDQINCRLQSVVTTVRL